MSNQNQMSMDFHQSLLDDPSGQNWLNHGNGGFHQSNIPQVFLCPETHKINTEKPVMFGALDMAYKFNEVRSSYSLNWHLIWQTYDTEDNSLARKALESAVTEPGNMPFLSDGTFLLSSPYETAMPATDLYLGIREDGSSGMATITIPRHGNRPSSVPRNHPESDPLPGAINLSFFDGHVQLTRLEDLWKPKWYPEYNIPSKRPGLK